MDDNIEFKLPDGRSMIVPVERTGNFVNENFFQFPIRVYEGKAVDPDEYNEEELPNWVAGFARIPGKDLSDLHWYDGFSHGREVMEVATNGFDITMVFHDKHGPFTCTWKREKFEEKLDEFMKGKCY